MAILRPQISHNLQIFQRIGYSPWITKSAFLVCRIKCLHHLFTPSRTKPMSTGKPNKPPHRCRIPTATHTGSMGQWLLRICWELQTPPGRTLTLRTCTAKLSTSSKEPRNFWGRLNHFQRSGNKMSKKILAILALAGSLIRLEVAKPINAKHWYGFLKKRFYAGTDVQSQLYV